jgi:hypothetical protein
MQSLPMKKKNQITRCQRKAIARNIEAKTSLLETTIPCVVAHQALLLAQNVRAAAEIQASMLTDTMILDALRHSERCTKGGQVRKPGGDAVDDAIAATAIAEAGVAIACLSSVRRIGNEAIHAYIDNVDITKTPLPNTALLLLNTIDKRMHSNSVLLHSILNQSSKLITDMESIHTLRRTERELFLCRTNKMNDEEEFAKRHENLMESFNTSVQRNPD